MAKRVLVLFLVLASPGRRFRSDTTTHEDVMTGHPSSNSVAPGDLQPDALLPEVPLLGCSEHASCSKHWSKNEEDTGAPQRGHQAGQGSQEGHETGRQDQLSDMKAPGASDMCPSLHTTLTPMSDMKLSVQGYDSPRDYTLESGQVINAHARHDSRLIFMRLQPCWLRTVQQVCDLPRAVCAHPNLGRSDTCPGSVPIVARAG